MTTFDAAALRKCHDRLAKAKRSFEACRGATTFDDFVSSWGEFLIHSGSVVNAVEAGSRSTPQGRQWYGGVRREGKSDPLLTYMRQSRNHEEHQSDHAVVNVPMMAGRNGNVRIFVRRFMSRRLAEEAAGLLDVGVDEAGFLTPLAGLCFRLLWMIVSSRSLGRPLHSAVMR